jgi:hypothetical protein
MANLLVLPRRGATADDLGEPAGPIHGDLDLRRDAAYPEWHREFN